MSFVFRYRGNGQFFCDEPYVTTRAGETLGGRWSSVDKAKDATLFKTTDEASAIAEECGLTGNHWQLVPLKGGRS